VVPLSWRGGSGRPSPGAVAVVAPLSCDRVVEEAAALFGVGRHDVCGHGRASQAVAARLAAMYVCRVVADESLATIGRTFGGRDDTTVLQSVRLIDQLMTQRSAIHAKVVELTGRLGAAARPGGPRPGQGRVVGRPAG